jgi:hypothetical protein
MIDLSQAEGGHRSLLTGGTTDDTSNLFDFQSLFCHDFYLL